MSSDFLWAPEEYVQRINPLSQYVEQGSHFLSTMNGIPLEEAKEFIGNELKSGRVRTFKDPEMVFFERDENYVKTLKRGSLMGYIKDAINKGEVIVPTLTTYVNGATEESLVSKFMKRNAERRGVLKKQAQVEEARGNHVLAYNLNMDQDNAKRNNNSMSGSMAALGSIFENPTGHNTLTSMTRTMSSLSNALNERMIGGNRHYFECDTAINNMTAIITTMDVDAVKRAIEKYGLVIPTPAQVAAVVKKSADQYWRDRRHIDRVEQFAKTMSGAQRAAVVYTQDIYHVRELNPQFMRQLIDDFSLADYNDDIGDPLTYLQGVAKKEPLVFNYAPQVHAYKLKGADKDLSKWDPAIVREVAYSASAIIKSVEKYKDFIRAFLVVRTLPCSTGYIDTMARKSVVLSDTDSTMFSVDEWVIWYFGELTFEERAFGVAGCVMFIATQLIAHAMAVFSANMNVARDKLFVLAMKPEFMFPVFAQSPVAKHYFCSVFIKEGAVFAKNKYEIKGVHNKSSASPVTIVKPAQDRMENTLEVIQAGKKLNGNELVTEVANIERKIYASLMAGEPEFYKTMFIKQHTSYVLPPEKSMYRFFDLWMQVFAPSYKRVDAPPYTVMKVPLTTTSRAKTNAWIARMEDRGLADRLSKWLADTGRKELPTFYISMDLVESFGMPKEITDVIDTKKIILDLTVINRMYLETIGFRPKVATLITEMGY